MSTRLALDKDRVEIPTVKLIVSVLLAVWCSVPMTAFPQSRLSGGGFQYQNAYSGLYYNNPTSALLDTMIRGKRERQALIESMRRRQEMGDPQAPAPPPQRRTESSTEQRPVEVRVTVTQIPPATVTFRPAGDWKMVGPIAERISGASKELQAEYENFFRQTLDFQDEAARKEGQQNHVGRALALYIGFNWIIAKEAEITEAQSDALLKGSTAFLLGSEQFRRMPDAQRQALWETLMIVAGFAVWGYGDGKQKGDAEEVKLFRQFATTNLENLFSVPIKQIALTDAGIVVQ